MVILIFVIYRFQESLGSKSISSDGSFRSCENQCRKNQNNNIQIDCNCQLKWDDMQYLIQCCYSGIIPGTYK